MKLLLPPTIVKRLRREVRGRLHEIGGVLVGEHVATGVFRVVDMSVQVRGGTVAHFVRDPQHHKAFLADFFFAAPATTIKSSITSANGTPIRRLSLSQADRTLRLCLTSLRIQM
jgi:hypothetical protein